MNKAIAYHATKRQFLNDDPKTALIDVMTDEGLLTIPVASVTERTTVTNAVTARIKNPVSNKDNFRIVDNHSTWTAQVYRRGARLIVE